MVPPAHDPSASSAAYAALRAGAEAAASTGTPTPTTDADYWRKEAEKVDALLDALWSGFLAAPTQGLPMDLAHYVSAFNDGLRLKLRILGYTAMPSRTTRTPASNVQRMRMP